MIIVGEKINGTRTLVAQAIRERNKVFIQRLALEQSQAGANFIDVNAGTHPNQEPADVTWLVESIQEVTETNLCIDSANPLALLAGIKAAKKLPMINSLSAEKQRIEKVLPIACDYKTELVALSLDDNGIPNTASQRLKIVRKLVGLARKGGLIDSKLYIDPLVTTIATDNNSGKIAFDTIRAIKSEFPEVHITCGLSNISFGQPNRSLINQAFAALAIEAGLDSAIIDPGDRNLRSMLYAAEMILGRDPDCLKYNQAQRSGIIGALKTVPDKHKIAIEAAFLGLSDALTRADIIKSVSINAVKTKSQNIDHAASGNGLQRDTALEEFVRSLIDMKKSRVSELTETLLNMAVQPLDILDGTKRAMVEVGKLFETGEYFLPELILAGKMLKDVAAKVKPHIQSGSGTDEKKGRIVIGTVEGDIHDIGKDIVVTMLEVNGYEVMDLGVDVPLVKFVDAARSFKPQVVGLSGFLTLAYDPMKETIAAVKREFKDAKFMIGGGQIDEHVKNYTGADAFGNDAIEAVKLCDQWINS
ncbi:MAG TPA: cobalamin-dependent protein [Candidatus Acidoferrales bacterium]|nr:cobalamin-dependent protein [Candidatus Acidoferrales bacterium]